MERKLCEDYDDLLHAQATVVQANKEGKVVRGLVVINPGNPTGIKHGL